MQNLLLQRDYELLTQHEREIISDCTWNIESQTTMSSILQFRLKTCAIFDETLFV